MESSVLKKELLIYFSINAFICYFNSSILYYVNKAYFSFINIRFYTFDFPIINFKKLNEFEKGDKIEKINSHLISKAIVSNIEAL